MLGITFATFALTKVTPGDPARATLGPRATGAQVAELREEWGLDENVVVQYTRFLGRLADGDLGQSNKRDVDVTSIIADRWPVTAWIVGMATVLSLLVAVPLASLAASRRDRGPDHVVRGLTTLGLGMPPFWIGIVLILLVGLRTNWFPVGGGWGPEPLTRLRATFLPALALAISLTPLLVRSLRSGMVGVLESDYIAASRSIGVDDARLIRRHVLRNSLVPLVSILAVQVGYLFFGSVLMEQTFDLSGLGSSMVGAAVGRDYPVVVGITLVFALAVVLVHLLADILLVLIDPRVKIS